MWTFFRSTGSGSKIRADFQNCHIWTGNLGFKQKFYKLYMDPLSTRGGGEGVPNWAYFRATSPGSQLEQLWPLFRLIN